MKKILLMLSSIIIISFMIYVLFEQNIFSLKAADPESPQSETADSTSVIPEETKEDQETEQNEETEPIEQPVVPLVPYNGIVEHIFFHPLIAYPELAFDGDYMEQGYNDYFTTISEFNRILEEMYARQFILVNLSDVYEEVNGEIVAKTLYLPEGKKPFVISIDDLNYYEYMIEHGNVYKLILDEQGKIATYAIKPDGTEEISYTNEIVPILDTFVEQHPDFSLNGAKGTIALTGYEGILGYRTQEGSPNRETEITEVLKIVEALKNTGWIFASHSYGHLNVTNASLGALVQDTEAWKREVETLVGPTPLFIYPYGARADYDSEKFRYLVDNGYKVISAVGPNSYTKVTNGAYTMDRRHMDGIGFIIQPHTMTDLFNVDYVLDKELRPAKYWQK